MKYLALAGGIALASIAFPAFANGNEYQQTKPINNAATAAALAAAQSAARSDATVVNRNTQTYRAAASSAYAPSGNVTAPCQKYASAGGQGINFGFSFGLSLDSKRCWTMEQAREYRRVYGAGVIRAYYEANDPVLRKVVASQPKAKPVKSKPVKRATKKSACGCK